MFKFFVVLVLVSVMFVCVEFIFEVVLFLDVEVLQVVKFECFGVVDKVIVFYGGECVVDVEILLMIISKFGSFDVVIWCQGEIFDYCIFEIKDGVLCEYC